jgi:hypothetical protein
VGWNPSRWRKGISNDRARGKMTKTAWICSCLSTNSILNLGMYISYTLFVCLKAEYCPMYYIIACRNSFMYSIIALRNHCIYYSLRHLLRSRAKLHTLYEQKNAPSNARMAAK